MVDVYQRLARPRDHPVRVEKPALHPPLPLYSWPWAGRWISLRHLYGATPRLVPPCTETLGVVDERRGNVPLKETNMDIAFVALMIGFFAVSAALVYGLERLRGPQ